MIRVEDIGDADLLSLRETRPRREFCWTCAAPLVLSLLKTSVEGEIVTYLDADLAFYSDPAPVFAEMGEGNILIHAHRFAPRYQAYAATSGNFNVGLVAARNAPEGLACMERWRAQCLKKCVLDPNNGYCGDQKYLDDWPSLYKSLVILEHPGAGLAPWNVENYTISRKGKQVTVDGKALIFYHYHALSILGVVLGRCVVHPAVGYELTASERRLLYRPYARMLREAQADIVRVSPAGRTAARPTIRNIAFHLRHYLHGRQFVFG